MNEPTTRYYFWHKVPGFGWRQMGQNEGYSTLKDLFSEQNFVIKGIEECRKENAEYEWRVLEANEMLDPREN